MTFRRQALLVLTLALGIGGGAAAQGSEPSNGIQKLEEDKAHQASVAEPVAKARSAEARAARFRSSGDEAHARLADGLVTIWVESAREAVKAEEAEVRADEAALRMADAGKQVERERALVEEAIMQNGRLRAQVEKLEGDAGASGLAGDKR